MNVAKILMLISGGLFTGVALVVTVKCLAWKSMPLKQFKYNFERTVVIADRMQPPLLVSTVIAATFFAFDTTGMAAVLAFIAVVILLLILVTSLAILVPLQKRIIYTDQKVHMAPLEAMRRQWLQGHLGRSGMASMAFTLLIIAAAV